MLSEGEFQTAVDRAFAWLLSRGFRTEVESFGLLGYVATLTDKRRWVRLRWEIRDGSIFCPGANTGQFNDDPFRNPRPLRELIPRPRSDIEEAGAVNDGDESVRAALQRLSELIRDSSAVGVLE